MDKAMGIAVATVLLFAIVGGLSGVLWCFAFAIPIGIVIAIVAATMGWFND